MIISQPVRAHPDRDDTLVWPLGSAAKPVGGAAVTRCVMICTKDDAQPVVIDSNSVANAFDFSLKDFVSGALVQVLRWKPGVAIAGLFSETGTWRANVYLYDAVHTAGVPYGEFELVVFASSAVVPPAPSGYFLVVGFNYILKTTDALTFTPVSSGAFNFFYGICHAPELPLSIAISSAIPRVSISNDGDTWVQENPSSVRDWRCVVWASGLSKFVAGSRTIAAGNVMTSDFGTLWSGKNGPAFAFNALAYSPSQGVIVGALQTNGGTNTISVARSTDGINWTTPAVATARVWKGVCWSEPAIKFVMVGSADGANPSAICATSVNGGTWTTRTCVSGCWEGVCWSDDLGLFCAVGGTVPSDIAISVGVCDPQIMTSPDGITWTSRTPAAVPGGVAAILRNVSWSPGLGIFLAVGANIEFGSSLLMTSPDGINWTYGTVGSGDIDQPLENLVWVPTP